MSYKLKYQITIEADSPDGVMAALWNCWTAFRDGFTPICGSTPESRGARMEYEVKQLKKEHQPQPNGTLADYRKDVENAQAAYELNPSTKNFDDLWGAKDALKRHFPNE